MTNDTPVTEEDILAVCTVQTIDEESLGFKRTLWITDKDGNDYRALLIWDAYDGYEFMESYGQQLPKDILDLMMRPEFENTLDELTYKEKD